MNSREGSRKKSRQRTLSPSPDGKEKKTIDISISRISGKKIQVASEVLAFNRVYMNSRIDGMLKIKQQSRAMSREGGAGHPLYKIKNAGTTLDYSTPKFRRKPDVV